MKKNFLIMLLTVFCAGFAFAQNDNTVRGFVPGGTTGTGDNQTYVVFGQVFGDIERGSLYEVAEGLGQAQLISDTTELVIGCDDSVKIGNKYFVAKDFIKDPKEGTRDTFLTVQVPNDAIHNYDAMHVYHVFVCPCVATDCDGNDYDVFAFNNLCWTKTSMRTGSANCCGGDRTDVSDTTYSTDITPTVNDSIFGRLYTWEAVLAGQECNPDTFLQGICPCGWHIPTAAEIDTILNTLTDDLRSTNGHWVVAGANNKTKFTAEPSGFYNTASQRFEGYHSEVDFWYVGENCTPEYFQILYYCDSVKFEHRNTTDALSVRCVKNMLDEEEDDSECPEIMEEYSFIDNVFSMPINNYNTNVITGVTVNYYVMTAGASLDMAHPISGTYEVLNPDNDNASFTFRSTLPSSIDVSELGQDDMIYIQIQFQINQDYADECHFTNEVYVAIYPQY